MSNLTIYLGNKNYSSWSLRAWLALKATGLAFDEVVIPLDEAATGETIWRYSPSGRVPALHHDGLIVWDSLAIGEYLNELAPATALLPADTRQRAIARSAIAEMHSGFAALRSHLPMNIRAHYADRGIPEPVQADINRVTAIWRQLRRAVAEGEAPFLFGGAGLADYFFAPVVSRFKTYGVPLDDECQRYADAVRDLPAMREWAEAARNEPMISAKYEF